MADFRYGDNYMMGDRYYTPDGRRFDDRASRNATMSGEAEHDAYFRSVFGGGGGGGGAPQGGGYGGGGLGGAYAGAFNAARGANEGRYNDILSEYDKLLGGGGGGSAPKKPAFSTNRWSQMANSSPVASWQQSGSQMSFSEWRALQKRLEQQAAASGGAYGSIDASRVYPRMWGQGEFLGAPGAAQPGGAYGQRPTIPPPVYPTYTPATRGNQNY